MTQEDFDYLQSKLLRIAHLPTAQERETALGLFWFNHLPQAQVRHSVDKRTLREMPKERVLDFLAHESERAAHVLMEEMYKAGAIVQEKVDEFDYAGRKKHWAESSVEYETKVRVLHR
jgi:hypothetical protein